MRIFVKAKPKAKEERVLKIDPSDGRTGEMHFIVWVKEPPTEGRANWGIERALGKYFGVPPSSVRIVSGHASRDKIIEISI
jgi:uncharacterized protein YggU (UPF0235/DUF167 family)